MGQNCFFFFLIPLFFSVLLTKNRIVWLFIFNNLSFNFHPTNYDKKKVSSIHHIYLIINLKYNVYIRNSILSKVVANIIMVT